MALSDLYKVKQVITKKVEFSGESFDALLMTSEEMAVIGKLEVYEQLSKCIFEDGKSLFQLGQADNLKNNMPLAHQKELMDIITSVNGLNVSYDEIKKN